MDKAGDTVSSGDIGNRRAFAVIPGVGDVARGLAGSASLCAANTWSTMSSDGQLTFSRKA